MKYNKKNILITGLPGVGKTTLIKKLSQQLQDFHPAGFYTEEIREGNIRKGFSLISLNGRKKILSHIDIKSPYRVGKYRVDIESFEEFLDSILFLDKAVHLIIIDEIGKMECLSGKFREIVKLVLNSDKLLIATIALKGSGMIEEIKKRDDAVIFELTASNRELVLEKILTLLSKVAPDL